MLKGFLRYQFHGETDGIKRLSATNENSANILLCNSWLCGLVFMVEALKRGIYMTLVVIVFLVRWNSYLPPVGVSKSEYDIVEI